MYLINYPLL